VFTSALSARRLLLFRLRPRAVRAPLPLPSVCLALHASSPIRMAPPQSITVIDPLLWPRLTVTRSALCELVNTDQLVPNEDGQPAAWIVPSATDREPNPSFGYVISFICFHECSFAAPVSRFMRRLCYHYGVEADEAGSHVCRRVRGIPGDPRGL
jgi:hypothetical protein